MGKKFENQLVSRRDLVLYGLLPLLATWGIDLATQTSAGSLKEPWFIGLLGLVPMSETSFLLGGLTELPVPLVNIAAISVAALLAFVYVVLQWSMTTQSVLVRLGLSFFLGGVLGHACQRVLHGGVVSFIAFGSPHLHTPPFNLGDIFQMFGVAMAVAGSWRDTGTIWPYRNARSSFSYWVNPKFQLRLCLTILMGGIAFAAVTCAFGYFFIRGALISAGAPQVTVEQLSQAFLFTSVLLATTFLSALFFAALVQSHRIIGPIYAFERFLEDLLQGRARKLKLRGGDEFRQFEKMAEELEARLGNSEDRKSA